MKRFLSLLLALCMAAVWLPAGAMAENNAGAELPRALSGTWTNPLYEGVAAQEPVEVVYPHEARKGPDDPEMIFHTDPAAAGEEIRAAMEKREEFFSVGYQIPYEQYTDDGLFAIVFAILDAACAHTGVPTQGDYLEWQYGGGGFGAQGISHNDEGTAYNSVITFNLDYYTDAGQEKAVTKQVDRLLKELNPTGTDYEKLTTVYDWICDNVEYDYDHRDNPDYKTQFTAYGALMDGTSVCQGYALLLYRLALEMGIDCRLISGTGITPEETGAHAWNILEMDGTYYNADATWDINYAENDDYAYYLLCEEKFGADHIRDAEFTTSEFAAAYPMGEANYDPPAAAPDDDRPAAPDDDHPLSGDLNDDGTIDDNDVARLLWYTLFSDAYEINGNADFNDDGIIDDADVAYLLWHTLFPDAYPIG